MKSTFKISKRTQNRVRKFVSVYAVPFVLGCVTSLIVLSVVR